MNSKFDDGRPVPEELLDEFLSKFPENVTIAGLRGAELKELYEKETDPEKRAQYKALMEQAEAEFFEALMEEMPGGELN